MPLDFGDKGTSIIRFSRIVKGSICERRCRVNWDNGQEYDGALIIAGKLAIYNYPAILFERSRFAQDTLFLLDTMRQAN